MSPAFRHSLVFIKLVRVPIQSILVRFYPFEPGSGFYQTSPNPDFIYFESGSGFYQGIPGCESGPGFYPFFSPGPNFIYQVRVRILFIFESGSGSRSGFYQACPGPCPGSFFTNTPDFSRFFTNYFTRY